MATTRTRHGGIGRRGLGGGKGRGGNQINQVTPIITGCKQFLKLREK